MIDYLQTALCEIGTNDKERITEYLRSVGLSYPNNWCAAFVNWCLNQNDYIGINNGLARSFLNWGYEIQEPKLGCIVVLKRGVVKWQGHVGFWLDEDSGLVRVLGGNQKGRVGINAYLSNRILGYRLPR